jgi:hypothetical protein
MTVAAHGAEGGNRAPLGDQKAVGSNAERGVMMKAAPAAAFVVTKAEFLLQLLVIAFDPPTQLGLPDEIAQTDVSGQGGEPVFHWLFFVSGPFDETPLLVSDGGPPIVTVRRADTHGGEAGSEGRVAQRAPARKSTAQRPRLRYRHLTDSYHPKTK